MVAIPVREDEPAYMDGEASIHEAASVFVAREVATCEAAPDALEVTDALRGDRRPYDRSSVEEHKGRRQ